jgi:hypothetical protein
MKEVSKRFFFEKKPVRAAKQKTSVHWATGFETSTVQDRKFFGSPGGEPFFQKRTAFL